MNCRSAEPLLSAFLEDDLSQKERRSLEAHLLACRRCSLSVRELRATLELMQNVPYMETSPHFEEDLLARIRSGEAMRPTVVEWLKGLIEPARLRPLFLAGAGACAVWIGVMVVNPNGVNRRTNVADVTVPSHQAAGPSVAATPSQEPSKVEVASLAAPSAGTETVQRQPNGRTASHSSPARGSTQSGDALDESVWPTPASSQDAAVPNPASRYDDQYITDQFFLERDLGGSNNPTITPVSDRPSDDVYITF
ncbi:MAG TPA: zf-HC2 domain-containing protein [Candidatus Dormibacteraeota bacterium]|nr:zf-HC2 domain-containing protein [Candidatus Dormibacteraeota bacterium]